ncbi:PREDICTED: coiled-coil domain-containing protein 14-like [Branchiostoma belcheri]|uniref:Coiled-coil domain-containing protein 14-like n=1 Tax=Branchiostoma belcheri TaxID=7741 RepID=A0A6P4ZJC7_BRABE|nr:PREDICTED: coiled-coil domain-containing protein 14-like [Branchiostoma belcheri]
MEVKSVPGVGRGRGAAGRGTKKPVRGKRAPSPVYSEAGFSLYSTDSEDQVTSTNKGLDRCAALLGDILSREPAERSTTQGLKQKPNQQPKPKTKPNPAKTKVPPSKTKTTKPAVKKTTAPQQTTARRSPEKTKQGNLSPYAFRVPTVPVQGPVLQQQVPPAAQKTLFNERIPSSTPNLSPDPKRPPSPNTLLQMLRAQNRAPVQNVPHSPPQKDGGQYQPGKDFAATPFHPAMQPPQYEQIQSQLQHAQLVNPQNYPVNQPEQPHNQQTYQPTSGYYQPGDNDRYHPPSVGDVISYPAPTYQQEYTTANDQRGGREQLDSVPVRDRETISPARRALFQTGAPVVDQMQGNESKTDQEQDDLDETVTSSPKRPPSRASEKEVPRTSPGKSLQTLRYLLRELQAAADDPEVKRLAQEVERIVGQLPETRRAADIQTDINLALQPLRSENSQLRRRVRILNQQLREKERAERENRAPDFSFEVESLRSLNLSLEKQLQDQAGHQEELQCRVEDLRQECDRLRLDNKNLLDMVGQQDTHSLSARAEWDSQMVKVKQDVSATLQQVQGLKLKLEAVEMENGTLLVTIRQKDAEIRRLETLTRDLHSSMSYLLRDLQNSGPGGRNVDGLTLERVEHFLRTHSVDSVIQLASPEGGQPNFYGSPTRRTAEKDLIGQPQTLPTNQHQGSQLPRQQEPRPPGGQLSQQHYSQPSHHPSYHGNQSPRQQWEPRPTAVPTAEQPKTPASVKRALQFDDVNGKKKENITGSSLTEQHLADHQRSIEEKSASKFAVGNSSTVPAGYDQTQQSLTREAISAHERSGQHYAVPAPPSPQKQGVGRKDALSHSFNGYPLSDFDHDSTMYASLPSNVGRTQWKPTPTRAYTERKPATQRPQENGGRKMQWYQSSQPYKENVTDRSTNARSFQSGAEDIRPNSKQDHLFRGTVLDSSLSTVNDIEAQSIASETTVTSQDERVFQQELAELDANIAKVQASLKGAVTFKLP